MTATTFDPVRILPSQITRYAKLAYDSGNTAFFLGPPGIGKTHISHELGDLMGFPVSQRIHWEMSQYHHADDMLGTPFVVDGNLKRVFEAFPKEIDLEKPVLIIIDEITIARPGVAPVLMALIHEKRLGGLRFAEGSMTVCMGNEAHQTPENFTFSAITANRGGIYYVRPPSGQEWVDSFYSKLSVEEQSPQVAFLATTFPNLFIQSAPDFAEARELDWATCTPRSLMNLGKTLLNLDNGKVDAHEWRQELTVNCQGYLGMRLSAEFQSMLVAATALPFNWSSLSAINPNQWERMLVDADNEAKLMFSLSLPIIFQQLLSSNEWAAAVAAKNFQQQTQLISTFLQYFLEVIRICPAFGSVITSKVYGISTLSKIAANLPVWRKIIGY